MLRGFLGGEKKLLAAVRQRGVSNSNSEHGHSWPEGEEEEKKKKKNKKNKKNKKESSQAEGLKER